MDRSSAGLVAVVAALLGTSAVAALAAAPRSSDAAPGEGPPVPAHPDRIVSTNLPADEILLELVGPERIAALSRYADHPAISNVRARARTVPHRVLGLAEPILALHPDLVLAFPYGQKDVQALLRQAGVPVVPVPGATSVRDVASNVRRIGRMVGETERAEALVTRMERTLARVRDRVRGAHPPRALLWHVTGTTAGAHTLFDDLLRAAGGRNAARELGIEGLATLPLEQLLALDPDVVFVIDFRADARAREVGGTPRAARDPRWRTLSAARSGRIHVLPAQHAYTSSHHAVKAAQDMARLLHPDRFGTNAETDR